MICPKCGSNEVVTQTVVDTTTENKTKGFGCFKACIGFFLFNVPGILCGLCGMGKGKVSTRTSQKVVNTCQKCGHRF